MRLSLTHLIVVVILVFGLDVVIRSAAAADLDGGQVGLIWMDALLVSLEAVDALELLVAVWTLPHCLV